MTFGTFTDDTCGEACWQAKEDICRCSCGGENHGIHLIDPSAEVDRTSKIQGHRYKLVGIGAYRELYPKAALLIMQNGFHHIVTGSNTHKNRYHYILRETQKGAVARLRVATEQQVNGWKELEPYFPYKRGMDVYLLWELIDKPVPVYCEDECEKCFNHKMKYVHGLG